MTDTLSADDDLTALTRRRDALQALKGMDPAQADEIGRALAEADAELERLKRRKPAAHDQLASRSWVRLTLAEYSKAIAPILKGQSAALRGEIVELRKRVAALEGKAG